MFREMRRKKQMLSKEETLEILNRNTSGVLSVMGDDGYPYGVPVSYVYDEGRIYIHSAKSGHKADGVRNYPKACFTVIDMDRVVPEEYTTYFRSAIAFGKVGLVTEEEEKIKSLHLLGEKYNPGDEKGRMETIRKSGSRTEVIVFKVEHLSGKQAIELTGKASDEA